MLVEIPTRHIDPRIRNPRRPRRLALCPRHRAPAMRAERMGNGLQGVLVLRCCDYVDNLAADSAGADEVACDGGAEHFCRILSYCHVDCCWHIRATRCVGWHTGEMREVFGMGSWIKLHRVVGNRSALLKGEGRVEMMVAASDGMRFLLVFSDRG